MRLATDWLSQLYGQGPNREWVYGRVPRRIIVEVPGANVMEDGAVLPEAADDPGAIS